MAPYGGNRAAARLLLRRLALLVLFVVLMLAFWGVWGVYQKERSSRHLRVLAEAEQIELEARRVRLAEDIARLGTDRGKEEELRERYGLADAGEGLIVIIEPLMTTTTRATSTFFKRVRNFLIFW